MNGVLLTEVRRRFYQSINCVRFISVRVYYLQIIIVIVQYFFNEYFMNYEEGGCFVIVMLWSPARAPPRAASAPA